MMNTESAKVRQVEEVAPDDWERELPLQAIVDEYLTTQRGKVETWVGQGQREEYYREPSIHLSGLECGRKAVLKFEGHPETEMTAISARRFAAGNMFEALFALALESKGALVKQQLTVWMDWLLRPGQGHAMKLLPTGEYVQDLSRTAVRGRLDWIVKWGGKIFLLDCKTVNSMAFDYADRDEKPGYNMQLAMYASLYRRQHGSPFGPIYQARIVYVEKDTVRIKQVGVNLDKWIPLAYKQLETIRNNIVLRTTLDLTESLPPEMPASEGRPLWLCNPLYCGFAAATKDGAPACPTVRGWWEQAAAGNVKFDYKTQQKIGPALDLFRRVNGKE